MTRTERKRKLANAIKASTAPDWQQAVLNGGPPCFHIEKGRFCFRTEHWMGHLYDGGIPCDHEFVSIQDLLKSHQ